MNTLPPRRRGAPRRAPEAAFCHPIRTYVDTATNSAIERAAALEGLGRAAFIRRVLVTTVAEVAR